MSQSQRKRLDAELVRRGIAASRRQASELISQSKVTVSGAITTNAARQVAPSEPIELIGPPPRFVGRGGEKLAAALENFDVNPKGKYALDVGASTGGFTDCWLQNGATRVVALDVGHGQLHERLRADERVEVRERTNIRHVTRDDFDDAPFPLISVDVSFISLRTIAEPLIELAAPDADIICLIKPQFEAGRREVSKGRGVIKDAVIWREVLESTVDALARQHAATMGLMTSPLIGADGNVEFLGWFRIAPDVSQKSIDVERAITDAVSAAQTGLETEKSE